jgi:hypothetical protein
LTIELHSVRIQFYIGSNVVLQPKPDPMKCSTNEQTQDTLALLKILALGQQDIQAGRLVPADQVLARLRQPSSPVSTPSEI